VFWNLSLLYSDIFKKTLFYNILLDPQEEESTYFARGEEGWGNVPILRMNTAHHTKMQSLACFNQDASAAWYSMSTNSLLSPLIMHMSNSYSYFKAYKSIQIKNTLNLYISI
jgi:hypothetical protein